MGGGGGVSVAWQGDFCLLPQRGTGPCPARCCLRLAVGFCWPPGSRGGRNAAGSAPWLAGPGCRAALPACAPPVPLGRLWGWGAVAEALHRTLPPPLCGTSGGVTGGGRLWLGSRASPQQAPRPRSSALPREPSEAAGGSRPAAARRRLPTGHPHPAASQRSPPACPSAAGHLPTTHHLITPPAGTRTPPVSPCECMPPSLG
jgi:hypothetical protein